MGKSRKFNKDREWLILEYVIKDRPRSEIALECGLTVAGLKSVLILLDVKKEKLVIKLEVLTDLVNLKLSAEEIADKLNCSVTSVYRYIHKYNLKILANPKVVSQYDSTNDEKICAYYMDGMSTTLIAKIFNTTSRTIIAHLKHCEIPRRTLLESLWNFNGKKFPEDLKDYDKVYDMYVTQRLSKKDIGEKYNCDPCVIDKILKEFNIPVRNNSLAHIGLMIGDKHPNWQGGITGLHTRLREAFYILQVPKVLKRDNYCCQMCSNKKSLLVHHKKHFSEILKRILFEHSDLDPIKDLDKLYEIALCDKEFCDLDNLITYCKECHLFKIHGYQHRK